MTDLSPQECAIAEAWEKIRPRTPEEFLTPKLYFDAGVGVACEHSRELARELTECGEALTLAERYGAEAGQREQKLREALKAISETYTLNEGPTADADHLRTMARDALADTGGDDE